MVDFQKGQDVTISVYCVASPVGSWRSQTVGFYATEQFPVTRVNKNSLHLRRDGLTYSVPRENIDAPNGEVWEGLPVNSNPKPKARKIGEQPDGDHISIDDPRIQWIFEDAARVAKTAGHCYEYDELCDKVGIPGRERKITISTTINGLDISTTVTARSRKAAEVMVKEKLTTAKA